MYILFKTFRPPLFQIWSASIFSKMFEASRLLLLNALSEEMIIKLTKIINYTFTLKDHPSMMSYGFNKDWHFTVSSFLHSYIFIDFFFFKKCVQIIFYFVIGLSWKNILWKTQNNQVDNIFSCLVRFCAEKKNPPHC